MKHLLITLIFAILGSAAVAFAGGLYNEVTLPGGIVTYWRAGNISIDNTYNAIPSAQFTVEKITLIPGEEPATKFVHRVSLKLDDPMRLIPMRNPETGELTGAMMPAYGVYSLLYSMHVLAEEDALKDSQPATIEETTQGPVTVP